MVKAIGETSITGMHSIAQDYHATTESVRVVVTLWTPKLIFRRDKMSDSLLFFLESCCANIDCYI